jgi:threonine/homoserine/homoserine lactone efflux protein
LPRRFLPFKEAPDMTNMTPELLAALALFALASSVTPGPNNTMLLASGANFGMRRTLPHMAGVVLGFLFLMASTGLGLGALFTAFPVLHTVLKAVGAAYLIYLAVKIARSSGIGMDETGARPMTFWQAVAFQWVNPKAWAMALGAVTTYAPRDGYAANVLIITLVFGLVNLPCVAAWAGTGVALRRFLDRPGVLRVFNVVMATLLIVSLYPLGIEFYRWLTQG